MPTTLHSKRDMVQGFIGCLLQHVNGNDNPLTVNYLVDFAIEFKKGFAKNNAALIEFEVIPAAELQLADLLSVTRAVAEITGEKKAFELVNRTYVMVRELLDTDAKSMKPRLITT